ncbi:MAG: 2-amino-4-oxopentanoate thiolase subunit OrtA [Acholeplasmataceae bacterium]|jgi:hypothetical protein|nr:2-amino-4-oxopentanoate thiolase subunit OrtA [Acholeplasmataceae bacterium]
MIQPKTYVEIYRVILPTHERSKNLPVDTSRVPFEMRIRGRLLKAGNIGDVVTIETPTKRIETGILVSEEPYFAHSFGHYVPMLTQVRNIILEETEDLS